MLSTTRRFGAAAIAASLLFAACGDDDTTETTDDSVVPTTVDDGAMDDMDHDHDLDDDHDHGEEATLFEVPAEGAPTISVEVVPNAAGGFTVEMTTTNFAFVPEDGPTEAVAGEGHVHVYLDDVKLGRAYSETYDIPDPGEGSHQVRVELSTVEHSVYAVAGTVIDATVEFEGTAAGNAPSSSDADTTIEVSFSNGVSDGELRYEASLGDTVSITVTSDVADELHVHGYDETADLDPGEPTTIVFVADIGGVFEVELEGAHELLFDLAVS